MSQASNSLFRTPALVLLCATLMACPGDDGESCPDQCLDKAADVEGCLVACQSKDVSYANEIVEAPGDTGEGNGNASNAINGVRGCGETCGSHDVFSLGYESEVDNYVVLRWAGKRVLNGPGVDFVVFENGFVRGSGPGQFMDHLRVSVSQDGVHWVVFPHDYTAPDETLYSWDPAHWPGFAGIRSVLLHEEENPVDPFDPEQAGGDGFDLDTLPDDGGEGSAIRRDGFVYLKLVSAPSGLNPDTGEPYVKDPISNGADIDGVYGRWLAPTPH